MYCSYHYYYYLRKRSVVTELLRSSSNMHSSSSSSLLRTLFSSSSSFSTTRTRSRFITPLALTTTTPTTFFHFNPPPPPLSLFSTLNHRFMPPPSPKPTSPSPPPAVAASYSTGGGGGGGNGESGNREILVQHLLVKEDNQKLLLDLHHRISSGEDLSDLAVEYSICPSKDEGGMLGWVRKGQMVPEFEEAAFNAPLNKVVRCKTQFGWHLLQVLSEREESLLQDIQPDELHVKVQDPNFLEEVQLIDVREPEEVAKASLPGFKVLPLKQFGSWGPEITTQFDPQKDTYVMCHHGVRSLQVAKWLQSQGFRKVYNVAGGIHAYAVQVDPSVPTY